MAIQTRGECYANTDAGFDPRVSLDGRIPQIQAAEEVVEIDFDADLFTQCQQAEALWAYHTWIGCFAPRNENELWHIPRAIKHLIPYYEHEFFRLVGALFHQHFPNESAPVFASELLKPIYRINFPQNPADAGRPNGDLDRMNAWGFAELADRNAQAAFIAQVAPHQENLKIACRALRQCIRDEKWEILPAQLRAFQKTWAAYVNASPLLQRANVTLTSEDVKDAGRLYYVHSRQNADDEIYFTQGLLPDEVMQRRTDLERSEQVFRDCLSDLRSQQRHQPGRAPVPQQEMKVAVEDDFSPQSQPTVCQQIGNFFRSLFLCLCCCFFRGSRESL